MFCGRPRTQVGKASTPPPLLHFQSSPHSLTTGRYVIAMPNVFLRDTVYRLHYCTVTVQYMPRSLSADRYGRVTFFVAVDFIGCRRCCIDGQITYYAQ